MTLPTTTLSLPLPPNTTLILPLPSHSNTPQLTADLLIASLSLERLGFLGDGTTCVPFFGSVGDGSSKGKGKQEDMVVTGGMELLGKANFPYLFVQQRSPVLKSQKDAHISLITSFLSTQPSITSLLILVGADNSAATEEDHLTLPFRTILRPSASSSATTPLTSQLSKFPLYRYVNPESPLPVALQQEVFPPFVPGGGIARRLLDGLQMTEKEGRLEGKDWGALALWCAEGDNREDAMAMAGLTLKLVGYNQEVKLEEPSSWEGLFGGKIGQGVGSSAEIYG